MENMRDIIIENPNTLTVPINRVGGVNILHLAASRATFDAFKWIIYIFYNLLELSAEAKRMILNLPDSIGRTMFHYACRAQDNEASERIHHLLYIGFDP